MTNKLSQISNNFENFHRHLLDFKYLINSKASRQTGCAIVLGVPQSNFIRSLQTFTLVLYKTRTNAYNYYKKQSDHWWSDWSLLLSDNHHTSSSLQILLHNGMIQDHYSIIVSSKQGRTKIVCHVTQCAHSSIQTISSYTILFKFTQYSLHIYTWCSADVHILMLGNSRISW